MIEPTTRSGRESGVSERREGDAAPGGRNGAASGFAVLTAGVAAGAHAGLSDTQLLEAYHAITLTRALDERMRALNRQGKAPFAVSCCGHEAAQVGSALVLRPGEDWVVPYYRDLGVLIVLGMTAREAMLQFLSRAGDPCSGGRQMPSHWSFPRLKVLSGGSPVGTQILHATGIALASKVKREPDVTAVYFGEGATAGGDFHEGLNFAAIHRLPVVFVCENNGYAISQPQDTEMPVPNVADRAPAYAMPGEVVDGNDVVAVYEAMGRAVARARRGDGPTLLEAKTYRLVPHTSDDDDRAYRSREEVAHWQARDPVPQFRRRLLEWGVLTPELVAEEERRVAQEVDEATDYAERAPRPDPATLSRHVYADGPEAARAEG